MRRIFALVLIFVLLLLSVQAFGQISRKNQIEIYAGAGFPIKPDAFKDFYKMGMSLNAQYVIFPSARLGIPIFAGYERFTVDDQAISDLFGQGLIGGYIPDNSGYYWEITDASLESSGSASLIKIGAGIRPYLTAPEASTQIFLFGNASYNFLKTKSEVKSASLDVQEYYTGTTGTIKLTAADFEKYEESENRFGAGVGAGLEVPVGSSFNMIFQGMYNMIFTKEESTSFVGVTAGVVF
ncbi:MAG: hypothetical protein P8184_12515 [Calditrichia bacterium]